MSENNFKLKVHAVLDKVKSVANIKADIKAIESKLPKLKIQGTLNTTSTRKELNSKLKSIKPKEENQKDWEAEDKCNHYPDSGHYTGGIRIKESTEGNKNLMGTVCERCDWCKPCPYVRPKSNTGYP